MPTVAYLGPEYTNTHIAARKRFGRRATYVHSPTVDEVFHLVERRRVDYGVVPIENSLEGAVTHTLDRFIDFIDTPVKIHGEMELGIRHALILHRGVELNGIAVVFSHPQALAQSRLWLSRHLSLVTQWETNSTAEAVEYLLLDQKRYPKSRLGVGVPLRHRAAIARAELARGKGLRAIPIPEASENKTRFLILGHGETRPVRNNKTSILFGIKDHPGALHDALVPFKRHHINLTKIESRPSKKKAWEYYFFIDFEGHECEPRVRGALRALESSTALLRVLGSYPVAKR